jgi:phosphohistidine phosphatase
MDLILWRHAEAEDGVDDFARPLTPRGRRQAARMAQWLKRHAPAPWAVYTSPARRALETVEALHLPFHTVDSCRPGATAVELLRAAGWPGHPGTVILVGHQPSLGLAVALALTGSEAPWSLRKGAVVWLNARERDGASPVHLRASIAPDLLTDS